MNLRNNIAPLGPDGVRQRMAEIQEKMAAVLGTHEEAFELPAEGKVEGRIEGTLPFSPFSGGASVRGKTSTAELRTMIEQAANDNQLDPALLDALVAAESAYDPLARSRAGALGLTQLMPDTAKSVGVTNPFDPSQNLAGGAKYLASMIDKFGDLKTALAAYNAGPGAVERAGGIPNYPETQQYVQRVLALYEEKRK